MQNRKLRAHLEPLGFDYVYEEGPGNHDWVYWDKMIARTLEWLSLDH
jgi:enterochelin esterase-like enzyme